jgi:hypothetical protein
MKRGGVTLALMLALTAGTRIAIKPAAPQMSAAYGGAARIAPQAPPPGGTSCSAFAGDQGAKGAASPGELTTLVREFVLGDPEHTKPELGLLPKGIRVVIATVPDPLHTLLNLEFDRSIDAIQQAAQDQGYTYDSSWLPWKAQSTEYSGRTDQNQEDQDTAGRELCPGLILFRSGTRPSADGSYDDAYTHGLFVFLVGEKPTTGINLIQWNNAILWINQHADQKGTDRALRVLGPTFSGSVSSMARVLTDLPGQASYFSNALLYSGTVSGCPSIQWLKGQLNKPSLMPMRMADFIENDAIQVDRYYKYLSMGGHSLSEVAVLSEDETAYGGLPDAGSAPPVSTATPATTPTTGTTTTMGTTVAAATGPSTSTTTTAATVCEPTYTVDNAPLHLYYPRDISALQSAYQEQSIFAPSTGDKSNTAHAVLQPQATRSTHHDTDTVATFSGANSALAQEAQMYGIVDSLKTHGIRFIILRSTNALDFLFLTRFLHRAYPDAFMVTMGADMLFGREIDSTEFRGVEALTTFPLLPRGQDWTRGTYPAARHAHRVFGNDLMEGTYLAMRFLITDPPADHSDPPLYLHKKDIQDYREPFGAPEPNEPVKPPTWLSVVGRDGYWPVAVLTKPYTPPPAGPISTVATVILPSPPVGGDPAGNTALSKLSLSPAWKFCCGLAVFAVCLHFYASFFGRLRENQGMFIQFAPLPGKRQFFLIGIGWATIASIVILMLRCSSLIGSFLEKSNLLWISVLYQAAWIACIGVVVDIASRSFAEPHSARVRALWAMVFVAFTFALVGGAYYVGSVIFESHGHNGVPSLNGVATAYRAVHLTNGVSPMVSLLLLLAGFYWWFWHTLSGLALFGEGRPILPDQKNLRGALARVSNEMACDIESLAKPLPGLGQGWVYLFPIAVLILPLYALWHEGPEGFDPIFHSLENHAFNKTLHILLALAVYLLIFECTQLMGTWLSLKRLLLALNRIPLRRTFSALQGLSMHSLWSLSGTSSRARYTIFSHQLESLFHLRNSLRTFACRDCGNKPIREFIDNTCDLGIRFVAKRGKEADLAMINDQGVREMRKKFCECAERLLTELIFPEWLAETRSMCVREDGEKADSNFVLPLSESEPIRHAEEFVCLIYVGYLQNLLARMRTMVLSIIGVLAGFAFSLAFYPYVPRPAITITLLMLVAVLGSAVAMVYAGLERDSTLSHITNTEPGKLGLGFWIRYGSFIIVPILGMLVAQFPAITDFVTSWIEPSLNAAK